MLVLHAEIWLTRLDKQIQSYTEPREVGDEHTSNATTSRDLQNCGHTVEDFCYYTYPTHGYFTLRGFMGRKVVFSCQRRSITSDVYPLTPEEEEGRQPQRKRFLFSSDDIRMGVDADRVYDNRAQMQLPSSSSVSGGCTG